MNSFHFLRPEWFLALPPLLALLFWLARRQLRSRSWQAVCDPELLPHLLLGRSVRRANWPIWLLLTGLLCAVVALAGPTWKRQPQPVFRQQSALVILFDLSRSMLAADLKPNRLLRARIKIEDLLRQRQEGQTALIVFAADAFTVTPLTEDRHTIEALLESLHPEIVPVQGSDPSLAIERGVELLRQAGLTSGRLLLVTDEDQPESAFDAARGLVKQGFEMSVLGVGSPAGAPIPHPEGGFYKDAQGNLILPRLNESGLRELAAAGGGAYENIRIDDSDLNALLAGLDDTHLNLSEQDERNSGATGDLWREEGIWLLWPLTLLAALAFRRGWILMLALMFLVPSPAEAIDWTDLWHNPDQKAVKRYEQQDYKGASELFQDQRWKASALYRAGDFESAAAQLEGLLEADDLYNRGNALAKAGDLPAAQQAYQQALKIQPEHADAAFNLELVKKALQQQNEMKKKQGEQKEQRDKEKQADAGKNRSPGQPSSSANEQQNKNPEKTDQSESTDRADKSQQEQSANGAEGEESSPPPESAEKSAAKSQESAEQSDGRGQTPETAQELPETAEQRESRMLLQQIPDDPGGLLRRKFLYQYRQRGQQRETDRPW